MIWIISIVIVIAAAFILSGPITSQVEQAPYKVTEKDGHFEMREYPSLIVAQVEVEGEREAAIKKGFRMIADYIFGDNHSSEKVAMTAPVTQSTSQTIAMTAPVTQQQEGHHWIVRFVMPASYTLETLPRPNNDQVKLKKVNGGKFAVIRFSGKPNTEDLEEKTVQLKAYLKEKHLKAISEPSYAFFNPPWTVPFLRRNEVMIEVE